MNIIDSRGNALSRRSIVVRTKEVDHSYVKAARILAHREGRVLERDGLAIFGIGTALYVQFPEGAGESPRAVTDFLQEIWLDNPEMATMPIAIAALPFDINAPSRFSVSEITVIARLDAPAYAIFVGIDTDPTALMKRDLSAESVDIDCDEAHSSPDHFVLDSVISHQDFLHMVNDALAAIRETSLRKVVLAREVLVTANRPFIQAELVERLRSLHPSCLSFAVDGFFGATPELVLRKDGDQLTSIPLAGTMPRSGDPDEDDRLEHSLMSSSKDRSEHQFVVDEISAILERCSRRVSVPSQPHILELRNVVHLATTITASDVAPGMTALEVAAALHPTPAVCGTPGNDARAFIDSHEGLSRDRYAGLVGYTDAFGDGEWWLGIRSAMVDGTSARMLAGVGIVEDSNPTSELAETQLKLQAMLAVLVRP